MSSRLEVLRGFIAQRPLHRRVSPLTTNCHDDLDAPGGSL